MGKTDRHPQNKKAHRARRDLEGEQLELTYYEEGGPLEADAFLLEKNAAARVRHS